MTYSCSDFTSSIISHLHANRLIPLDVVQSDNLERQAQASIAAISKLAMSGVSNLDPIKRAPFGTPAKRYLAELLETFETLSDIGETYGIRTLADCMYLLSAIQNGTYIEVSETSVSSILEVIKGLPSDAEWMQYVNKVSE